MQMGPAIIFNLVSLRMELRLDRTVLQASKESPYLPTCRGSYISILDDEDDRSVRFRDPQYAEQEAESVTRRGFYHDDVEINDMLAHFKQELSDQDSLRIFAERDMGQLRERIGSLEDNLRRNVNEIKQDLEHDIWSVKKDVKKLVHELDDLEKDVGKLAKSFARQQDMFADEEEEEEGNEPEWMEQTYQEKEPGRKLPVAKRDAWKVDQDPKALERLRLSSNKNYEDQMTILETLRKLIIEKKTGQEIALEAMRRESKEIQEKSDSHSFKLSLLTMLTPAFLIWLHWP